MPVTREQLQTFVQACHEAANRYQLVLCSSGNLSLRLDADEMLVSASASWMGDITPAQVAHMRIADEAVLNDRKPSVESRFHAGILRDRPEVEAVLHFQSPAATAIGCLDATAIDFTVVPEVPFYIGEVQVVPYIQPGTPELADAVIASLREHNVAILSNHGQVACGKTWRDALQKAVFFEMTCRILLEVGDRARRLPPEATAILAATGQGRIPGHV